MRVTRKIAIVGMTNPLDRGPEDALSTQPPGSTGHRLWQLANARSGISEDDWLEMTDRRNLCLGEWDKKQGWESARDMTPELQDVTTVLLGGDVGWCFTSSTISGLCQWGKAMGTPPRPGRPWVLIPHPGSSGRWYNETTNRAIVEILLADLVRMCTEETDDEADEHEESNGADEFARGDDEVALQTEL